MRLVVAGLVLCSILLPLIDCRNPNVRVARGAYGRSEDVDDAHHVHDDLSKHHHLKNKKQQTYHHHNVNNQGGLQGFEGQPGTIHGHNNLHHLPLQGPNCDCSKYTGHASSHGLHHGAGSSHESFIDSSHEEGSLGYPKGHKVSGGYRAHGY